MADPRHTVPCAACNWMRPALAAAMPAASQCAGAKQMAVKLMPSRPPNKAQRPRRTRSGERRERAGAREGEGLSGMQR